MEAHMKKVLYIVMSFIATFTFTLMGQGTPTFQEFFKNNVSPGFAKEILLGSTYLNDYIYVGTLPNAHIFKVDPRTNNIVKDFGAAGYSKLYTSKPGALLTSDAKYTNGTYVSGRYIFGCSYHLFYLDVLNNTVSNPIVACGLEYIRNNNIAGLYDPTYFEYNSSLSKANGGTGSSSGNIHKLIYFGTGNTDGNAKILKWDFTSTLNGNTSSEYELITLDTLKGLVEDISTGFYSNYGSVLYISVRKENIDQIVIYDIYNKCIIKQINIKTLSPSGLNSRNFVAVDSLLYLFGDAGSMYMLNPATSNVIQCSSSVNAGINPGNKTKYYYSVINKKIYTQCATINCQNPSNIYSEAYSSDSLDSRNIIVNKTCDTTYGIYSWADGPKNIIKRIGSNVFHSTMPDNYIKNDSFPTGGIAFTSLAVGSSNIYGGLDWSGLYQNAYADSPDWTILPVTIGTQADKITIDGPNRLYGIYSEPFLRLVNSSIDTTISLKQYMPPCDTSKQVRITDIKAIGNNKYIIGTGPMIPGLANSHGNIFLVYFSGSSVNIVRKGYIPTETVVSLEYFLKSQDTVRVFISNGNGLGIYDFAPSNMTVTDNEISISPMPYGETEALCRINNKLFVVNCASLVEYDTLSLSPSLFSSSSHYRLHASLFRQYCGPWGIPSIDFYQNGVCYNLIAGNDGLLYAAIDGTLLIINPNNIGTYPYPNVTRLFVPGYGSDSTLYYSKQGLEIAKIAKDANNIYNLRIYVGTNVGRIFVYDPFGSENNEMKSTPKTILNQNNPNPFNPTTNISYTISSRGKVELKVYNLLGQMVRSLVDDYKEAGTYSVTFNASHLASGVYFYQLKTDNQTISKKLLLLK